MPWPENNKANDILTQKKCIRQSSDAVSPEDASRGQNWCIVWRVQRWSEVQGSVESREACITPSEVDKAHQWPIYSTVQYQASSPPANTQWQHERALVCFSFMPIKTKLARSSKNFLSWEDPSLPFFSIWCGHIIQVRTCHDLHIFFPEEELSFLTLVWLLNLKKKPENGEQTEKIYPLFKLWDI